MDPENNVPDDTSTVDTDTQADDFDPETPTDPSADIAAQNEELRDKNIKLFERAKRAEGFTKQSDGTWVKRNPQPITKKDNELEPLKATVSKLELAERKRQFGYEYNLSPDETDAVFKANPNPTKEDLENPFIRGGLEALRAKKRVENNTPSPSGNSPTYDGKSFDQLSEADRKKNWPEYIRNKAAAKARS